jgi:hypothetical protein
MSRRLFRRGALWRCVRAFLDLLGRSGTAYRFRSVTTPDGLPAHAGNFVVARASAGPVLVVACGTRRSLVELAAPWPGLTATGDAVYVRLNVSRARRLAEHDDLAAALTPLTILLEAD